MNLAIRDLLLPAESGIFRGDMINTRAVDVLTLGDYTYITSNPMALRWPELL